MDGPATETSSELESRPENFGKHYSAVEILLVCLFMDDPEARARLARFLGRTEDAIDLILAWRDRGDKLPSRAANQITRQIDEVRELFGDVFDTVDFEMQRRYRDTTRQSPALSVKTIRTVYSAEQDLFVPERNVCPLCSKGGSLTMHCDDSPQPFFRCDECGNHFAEDRDESGDA